MDVSERGLVFLLDWEGFRPYLYDDGGRRGLGNATVAIGILVHLGPYHDRGQCAACDKWPRDSEPRNTWLTPAQGYSLLRDKVNGTGIFTGGQNYAGAVRSAFARGGITQNQFDAMVSYAYNYGSGAVGRMATAFYGGRDMRAAFVDERYLKPDWARDGLLRRRLAEYALWVKEDQMTEAERAEMKALREAVEAQRKELLTLAHLIATGRTTEADARVRYMATAGRITLP